MFVINDGGSIAQLGDNVFHSATANSYILARSAAEALEIVKTFYPKANDVEPYCVLNMGDSILHKGGVAMYVSHCNRVFKVMTNLVLGTKKGMDTTKPLKVEYHGNNRRT